MTIAQEYTLPLRLADELLDTGQRQLVGRHVREQGRALVTKICNAAQAVAFADVGELVAGYYSSLSFWWSFSYAYNVYSASGSDQAIV